MKYYMYLIFHIMWRILLHSFYPINYYVWERQQNESMSHPYQQIEQTVEEFISYLELCTLCTYRLSLY